MAARDVVTCVKQVLAPASALHDSGRPAVGRRAWTMSIEPTTMAKSASIALAASSAPRLRSLLRPTTLLMSTSSTSGV